MALDYEFIIDLEMELRVFYRRAYVEEFAAVVEAGLEYDLGSGFVVVNRRSVAELQRLRR